MKVAKYMKPKHFPRKIKVNGHDYTWKYFSSGHIQIANQQGTVIFNDYPPVTETQLPHPDNMVKLPYWEEPLRYQAVTPKHIRDIILSLE